MIHFIYFLEERKYLGNQERIPKLLKQSNKEFVKQSVIYNEVLIFSGKTLDKLAKVYSN